MRSKKNKKKLLIAISLGMVATMGILNMTNNQKAEMEALNKRLAQQNAAISTSPTGANPLTQQIEMSSAIIAKTDIKLGEIITINKIDRKEYKKSELPTNFLPNENLVLGKTAIQDILTGKIITSDDINSDSQKTLNIPDGMRAITIPTSSLQGLASYIYVGSRIDLLSVKAPVEFIAQNVKIIAFEAIPNARSKSASPAPPQPKAPPPSAPQTSTSPTNVPPANPGQPASSATRPPATASVPPSDSLAEPKATMSIDNASGITILVPTANARKIIDAMIEGKLQVLTRGTNDDKIVKVKPAHTPSKTNSLTPGSTLPPPPSATGKLPPLPGSPPNNSGPAPIPEKPKIEVEVIEAGKKRQVAFDDSSGRPATIPVNNQTNNSSNELKDLKNILKPLN